MNKWHIGDPVDWGDGWMDAQNWGHGTDEDERGYNNIETGSEYSERDEYSQKAWEYYLDNKYDDALYYINLALDLDCGHSNNWNKKAIILEYMGRYGESEKCYNKSLELRQQSLVAENKARMLRGWAGHLLSESRKMPNGLTKLEEALEKNRKAINRHL